MLGRELEGGSGCERGKQVESLHCLAKAPCRCQQGCRNIIPNAKVPRFALWQGLGLTDDERNPPGGIIEIVTFHRIKW